jgi:hypothetical protein
MQLDEVHGNLPMRNSVALPISMKSVVLLFCLGLGLTSVSGAVNRMSPSEVKLPTQRVPAPLPPGSEGDLAPAPLPPGSEGDLVPAPLPPGSEGD